MGKIKAFFGLEAQETQPDENYFGLAVVYSLVLLIFFVYLAVLQWPEAGIPSQLHQYNPELEGGPYWLADTGLGAGTKVIAWLAFAWKFLVYLTLAALMYRLAKSFHTRADFTRNVLAILKAAQLTLLIGMIVYSLLLKVVSNAVQAATGLSSLEEVPVFFSDHGLLALLFLAALFFIEGALRRGLTLQEDADATI